MKAYPCRIALAAALLCVTPAMPANADPPPPGCERIPIFGLNPQVREICDLPIQPDGSWTRWRWFSSPRFVGTPCVVGFPTDPQLANGCPLGTHHIFSPAYEGPVETYIVTPDTIPEGEPGHLG